MSPELRSAVTRRRMNPSRTWLWPRQRECLKRAGLTSADIGMFIVSSGSSERRFPGPASLVASRLGAGGVPALDVPMASAGGLFGMALAAQLAAAYGNILVVASEKMSAVIAREPMEQGVAILFGDGAGACIVSPGDGPARIVDSVLHSDGAFAEDLRLEFDAPLAMNGRSVIMQASRKIPGAIAELLERNRVRRASAVKIFLMHQANQNLIDRVAKALDVGTSNVLLEHPRLRQYFIGFHVHCRIRMVAGARPIPWRSDLLRGIRCRIPLGRAVGGSLSTKLREESVGMRSACPTLAPVGQALPPANRRLQRRRCLNSPTRKTPASSTPAAGTT